MNLSSILATASPSPTRLTALVLAAALPFTGALGCTHARTADAPTVAAARAADASARGDAPRRLVRVDLVLTTTEVGRPPSKSAHTLNVEEGRTAYVRLGSNVALSGSARTDVGLHIDCNVVPAGDDLLLETGVELTAVDEGGAPGASAIRKLSMHDDALLVSGKSAVIANTEDPVTHARYEVTATATKVR